MKPEPQDTLLIIDPKWLAPWQIDKAVSGYNAFSLFWETNAVESHHDSHAWPI